MSSNRVIDELPLIQEWMFGRECEGQTRLFFPTRHDPYPLKAIEVCDRCPVEKTCLDYALALGDTCDGVWGGTTKRERARIRRVRKLRGRQYEDQSERPTRLFRHRQESSTMERSGPNTDATTDTE